MAPSDVTSGAEAEQRLRLMAAAVEQVNDSVEIAEAGSLRLIYVNPAFTTLTGYTAEEALGRTPAELLRSDQHEPAFWAAMDAAIRQQHSWRGRITSRRKDGRLIHQRCTISPLTDEAGRVTHYVAVRHDLGDEERAAAALRASEARLKALMEHAPIVVHLKDREGRYLLANPESAKIFGCDPSLVIGRTPSELFPAREAELIDRHHREVLLTGQVVVYEEHQPSLDAYEWSAVIRFPIRDEDGRVAVVGAFALDITERKRAEAALRASEARFRAIVEDQTEFISRFTPDFRITFVNNAYAAQQRRRREDLIGSCLLDLMNEEQERQFTAQLAALTPEAPTISYEMDTTLADGSRGWEQWTDRALFDADGRLVEYQSVGRDITESRRTREELRQSEARFRAIVEDQTEVIVRFDKDLRLVFSNRANARLSGKGMEELVGTSFFDPIPEPLRSELRDALAALTPENPVHRGENPKTLPDGTERWFEWTNRALFDDAGQAIGYQTVGRDITERRAAEAEIARQREALHQREKLTALGSLLAGVAAEVSGIIRRGEATIGLRYDRDRSGDLDSELLFSERLQVVCAPDHPRAGRRVAKLTELRGERWIAFPVVPGRREISASHVFSLFQTHGLGEIDWTPVDSLTAQKRLVEAGLGIALLSESHAAEELKYATISTIGVRDLKASHDVVTVTRRGGFLSAAARRLLEIVRKDYRNAKAPAR